MCRPFLWVLSSSVAVFALSLNNKRAVLHMQDTPDALDSFLQMTLKTRRVKAANALKMRQDPESADAYEYGDRERAVSQGDSSDFSVHQFLTEDDGREGTSTSDDESGESDMEKSKALAADDHFNSEDTPDNSDSLLQTGEQTHKISVNTTTKRRQNPADVSDAYEYGDREMAVSQGDTSDFSVHQFLDKDDGREGTSTDSDDSVEIEMARSKALATDDHFNSEETPDNSDTFVQTGTKTHAISSNRLMAIVDAFEHGVSHGDLSDFSEQQLLSTAKGRKGTSANSDDSGEIELSANHRVKQK